MSQPQQPHDHTGIEKLLRWMDDDEALYKKSEDIHDGPFPMPHYWTHLRESAGKGKGKQWKTLPINADDMEKRLDDIFTSLSTHYFMGELTHNCRVIRKKNLVDSKGEKLDGMTQVREDDDGQEIYISLDFENHSTNKGLIETLLHEMAHAWAMLHGNTLFADDKCNKDECRLRLGAKGHGQDWLRISRALELRAERIHSGTWRLGRWDSIAAEMKAFAGGKLGIRMLQMLKIELGEEQYTLAWLEYRSTCKK